MLHTEILDPKSLELLKSLLQKPYLQDFYLVGGTALALHFGHRKSIDLDLFSHTDFETDRFLEQLQQDFPFQINHSAPFTLKGSINNVQVDFIAHRYPLLKNLNHMEELRIVSIQDILAMKLNAVAVSGQRSKDFIDLYYGFRKFNLKEMLSFYKRKYKQENAMHVLKSLNFFEDVDLSDWPVLLQEPELSWETVKEKINKEVLDFSKRNMDLEG
jgi:hypothetical protein